jgi:hypothetical protein
MGKMPVTDQLIKHHVDQIGLSLFEKRLRDSVTRIKQKGLLIPEKVVSSADIIHFLLMNRATFPIGGVIVSSMDVMRDPYPFVVFSQVMEKNLGRQQAAALMILVEFFEKSSELCLMDWGSQTLENLLLSIDSLPREHASVSKEKLFETEIDILKQIELKDYWEGIKPFHEVDQRAQFLMSLAGAYSKCNSKTPSKTQWGLRFPLPDTEFLLPFVILFTELSYELLNGKDSDLQVFWHQSNEHYRATLTLFAGPVQSASLAQVMDYSIRENFLVDIMEEMKNFDQISSAARELARQENVSLMETLFHWVHFIKEQSDNIDSE